MLPVSVDLLTAVSASISLNGERESGVTRTPAYVKTVEPWGDGSPACSLRRLLVSDLQVVIPEGDGNDAGGVHLENLVTGP